MKLKLMRMLAIVALVLVAVACDPEKSGPKYGTTHNDGVTTHVIQFNVQGTLSSYDKVNGQTVKQEMSPVGWWGLR